MRITAAKIISVRWGDVRLIWFNGQNVTRKTVAVDGASLNLPKSQIFAYFRLVSRSVSVHFFVSSFRLSSFQMLQAHPNALSCHHWSRSTDVWRCTLLWNANSQSNIKTGSMEQIVRVGCSIDNLVNSMPALDACKTSVLLDIWSWIVASNFLEHVEERGTFHLSAIWGLHRHSSHLSPILPSLRHYLKQFTVHSHLFKVIYWL